MTALKGKRGQCCYKYFHGSVDSYIEQPRKKAMHVALSQGRTQHVAPAAAGAGRGEATDKQVGLQVHQIWNLP